MIEIAKNPKHAHQRDAIRLLRDSHDMDDRTLGLTLQLTYFPPAYSKALQQTLQSFNFPRFREGFHEYRTGANVAEQTRQALKEENLPEFLAALKELVKDLGKNQDPQTERATLTAILHSILHCLTRQTELMTETVTSLNTTQVMVDYFASYIEGEVGRIVEEAFQQAFQGQSPQKIAQARFVLAAHIGLTFDPEEFCSPRIDDAEIPGILETFHKIFTEDFLVTQLCTRLQNKMNQHPKSSVRKKLVDHLRTEGKLETFGFQEDGSGTLNKAGALAILDGWGYKRRV